jgi:hypothetical protein
MNLCKIVPRILAVAWFLALTAVAGHSTTAENDKKTVYDYSLVSLDGKELSLSTFKARFC